MIHTDHTGALYSARLRHFRRRLSIHMLLLDRPLWSTLLALIVYTLLALWFHGSAALQQSRMPYHVLLADALLHGQLFLRLQPPTLRDLSLYQGHMYLYWGPFPALLLLPLVLVFGPLLSDVLFTVGMAALNVGLVSVLLRLASIRGVARLSRRQRSILVAVFMLGTVHVALAVHGLVWFTGQIVACTCVLLAYIVVLRFRGIAAFLGCGITLAAALLTRTHLVFVGLWPAVYLLWRFRTFGPARLIAWSSVALVPLVSAVACLGWYNVARFGQLSETGLSYQAMGAAFRADAARYGVISTHYIPINFYYQYLAYPLPSRADYLNGGSLFLLTPVFLAIFWALKSGRPRWSPWVLLATCVCVAIPNLMVVGGGAEQYGPRYSLDFLPPLLLLTAMGIRRWPLRVLVVLSGVGVVHYLRGAAFV
jgi:hypothetical protein